MLIEKVNSPEDLKKLEDGQMPALAEEIRAFLVESVLKNGGHLASNLGIVELTLALHRVFDCPDDKIIFDVGHQSYVHKLLTGRKDGFARLRKKDGISGFTKSDESKYDAFGAGHSSTALSAALGFAEAAKLKGDDSFSIAVVGDGAFTGGMVYEALNNCRKDLKLVLVLNDNEMSISKNVGRMSKYISDMRLSKNYIRIKRAVAKGLNALPLIGESAVGAVASLKDSVKKMLVYDSCFFESMGLRYFGPVDGNDYDKLKLVLEEAKRHGGCSLVHVTTKKGKGYEPAESNSMKYHSVSVKTEQEDVSAPTFSEAFGKALVKLGAHDKRVCALTAAMCEGTGLHDFSEKYPARFFDVGIAEAHAVTFGAGLAAAGMIPVFAVYSSFLQRAYDNLIHDTALQKLPMILGIDRAGLSADDGATHHGIYDVAMLGVLEDAAVLCPISTKSVEAMLGYAYKKGGIAAVRYQKGREDTELCNVFYKSDEDYLKIGTKCAFEKDGSLKHCKYVFVGYGRVIKEAYEAAKILNADSEGAAGVILLEMLGDEEKICRKIASLTSDGAKLIFVEEGIRKGGAGQSIQNALFEKYGRFMRVFAIDKVPDRADDAEDFYRMCALDRESLVNAAKEN